VFLYPIGYKKTQKNDNYTRSGIKNKDSIQQKIPTYSRKKP
jgi:hypothetical protein